MGKSVHNEETKKLMEGILKLQSVDECYAFFEDLCTVNELLSLGQRFEVANMLRNHKTYNEVAEATGASTATISRVNRCLNYGTDGYQLVLGRMEEHPGKNCYCNTCRYQLVLGRMEEDK